MFTSGRNIQLACVIVGASFAITAAIANEGREQWFLMSRHGDCTEIATLKRKLPELPDITSPASFARWMRAKGHAVSAQSFTSPRGDATQIEVLELSLHLLFVKRALCETFGAHD